MLFLIHYYFSLQTEIKLSILNFSFLKGILCHKHFSFETNFLKKKRVITSEKIFLRFFQKKNPVKPEPTLSSTMNSVANSKKKKKRLTHFFTLIKKGLKKILGKIFSV